MNNTLGVVLVAIFVALLLTICIIAGIIGNAHVTKTKECKIAPAAQIAKCIDNS